MADDSLKEIDKNSSDMKPATKEGSALPSSDRAEQQDSTNVDEDGRVVPDAKAEEAPPEDEEIDEISDVKALDGLDTSTFTRREQSDWRKFKAQTFSVDENGYHCLAEIFRITPEPSIGDAIDVYDKKIAGAFDQNYELHPHFDTRLNLKTAGAEMMRDFRKTELKRLAAANPADREIFFLIKDVVDAILIKNEVKYLRSKRHLVNTHAIFSALFALAFVFVLAADAYLWPNTWAALAQTFNVAMPSWAASASHWAGGPLSLAVAVLFGAASAWRKHDLCSNQLDQHYKHYRAATKSTLDKLVFKIESKINQIKNLISDCQSELENFSKPDETRAKRAGPAMRLLFWLPERVGFIENYYRAKMGRFLRENAENVLLRGRYRLMFETCARILAIAGVTITAGALMGGLVPAILVAVAFAWFHFRMGRHATSDALAFAPTFISNIMSGDKWTRYSTLKIDQKIANIYKTAYEAWEYLAKKNMYDADR